MNPKFSDGCNATGSIPAPICKPEQDFNNLFLSKLWNMQRDYYYTGRGLYPKYINMNLEEAYDIIYKIQGQISLNSCQTVLQQDRVTGAITIFGMRLLRSCDVARGEMFLSA